MQPYRNLSGNSGVQAYESGPGYIRVRFVGGQTYLYTDDSAGARNILRMQELADAGRGLATFISTTVRDGYA